MATQRPPSAPPVSADARLDIFAPPDATHPGTPLSEPYGNGRRLGLLGAKQFAAVYAAVVAERRRDLGGEDLEVSPP